MPGYQPISSSAAQLRTDEATLLDFSTKGWIQTVEKDGSLFLASHQRYRAKYILHLRKEKGLTDEQIDYVLSVQRPPYSAADVDRLLRERGLIAGTAESGPAETDKRRKGGSVAG